MQKANSLEYTLLGDMRKTRIRNPPALPALLQSLDHLLHSAQKYKGTLEKVRRRELGPAARQILGGDGAMLGHFHPLHQGIEFQLLITLTSRLADVL